MSVISCSNLKKSYGKINAVNDLSFDIEENKITGLIGRNGAGKTTFLKLAAGYMRPTSGKIRVFLQDPFDNIHVASNMIFIDENLDFPPALTLAEILDTAGSFYKNWDSVLAKKLSDYFSLNPRQHHNSLSKGLKSTFNSIVGIASRCPLYAGKTKLKITTVHVLINYIGNMRLLESIVSLILSSHTLSVLQNNILHIDSTDFHQICSYVSI
jgi:ABC-2 type transport system ATP-binding protein